MKDRKSFKTHHAGMMLLMLVFTVLPCFGITLEWGCVTCDDVSGYLIHYGTESGTYTAVIDVGRASEYTLEGLDKDETYYLTVSSYDSWGNVSDAAPEIIWHAQGTATGLDEAGHAAVPGSCSLNQNYPNPFNPTTTIPYTVGKPGHVMLAVYNIYGQKVTTLVDEYCAEANSTHQVVWDSTDDRGRQITSGVYVYSLIVNGHAETKRMIYTR